MILVGASLGANAVVAAGAAITPPVDGLVSLSAPGTFRQDAIAAAKQLSAPALFAAGEVDEGGIYATDAKSMYAADPGTDKQLVIVPGAKHGVALVAGPGKVRTARRALHRRSRGLETRGGAQVALVDAGGEDVLDLPDREVELLCGVEEMRPEAQPDLGPEVAEDLPL